MSKIFKIIEKPNLFFNKFKYKASFETELLYCTRYTKTVAELENVLKNRVRDIRNIFITPVDTISKKTYYPANKSFLDSFVVWKQNNINKDLMIRVDSKTGSVYSNDIDKLTELETLTVLDNPKVHYTKINLLGEPNILLRNNPKHNFRTYLRAKNCTTDFHTEMKEFFNRHSSLYPCSALKTWLEGKDKHNRYWRYRYCSSSFFVDYDNDSEETLLRLFVGDYLGKTYKIQQKD